jgi:hypothetical protein
MLPHRTLDSVLQSSALLTTVCWVGWWGQLSDPQRMRAEAPRKPATARMCVGNKPVWNTSKLSEETGPLLHADQGYV